MAAMTKRVNIRTVVPVKNTTPPIPTGTMNNVIMSTSDIMKCLVRRAIIEEILPDGSTVRLNLSNYFTDNGAGLDAYAIKKAETPKPTPVVEDHPKTEEINANVISSADLLTEEVHEESKVEEPVVEEPKTEETPVSEESLVKEPKSEEPVVEDEIPEIEESNNNYPNKKKKHK